jgi:hypothetical protein
MAALVRVKDSFQIASRTNCHFLWQLAIVIAASGMHMAGETRARNMSNLLYFRRRHGMSGPVPKIEMQRTIQYVMMWLRMPMAPKGRP